MLARFDSSPGYPTAHSPRASSRLSSHLPSSFHKPPNNLISIWHYSSSMSKGSALSHPCLPKFLPLLSLLSLLPLHDVRNIIFWSVSKVLLIGFNCFDESMSGLEKMAMCHGKRVCSCNWKIRVKEPKYVRAGIVIGTPSVFKILTEMMLWLSGVTRAMS